MDTAHRSPLRLCRLMLPAKWMAQAWYSLESARIGMPDIDYLANLTSAGNMSPSFAKPSCCTVLCVNLSIRSVEDRRLRNYHLTGAAQVIVKAAARVSRESLFNSTHDVCLLRSSCMCQRVIPGSPIPREAGRQSNRAKHPAEAMFIFVLLFCFHSPLSVRAAPSIRAQSLQRSACTWFSGALCL